jgi:hypothetical protein
MIGAGQPAATPSRVPLSNTMKQETVAAFERGLEMGVEDAEKAIEQGKAEIVTASASWSAAQRRNWIAELRDLADRLEDGR